MNPYIRPPYPNELYHYGVKGMKWRHRKVTSEQVANTLKRNGAQAYDSTSDYMTGDPVYDMQVSYYKRQNEAKLAATVSLVEDIIRTNVSVSKAAMKTARRLVDKVLDRIKNKISKKVNKVKKFFNKS